ncbi:MAG TPA: hypothetical protein VMM85_00140, partial [Methylomirabilota bacterium]|nr:hypothetical protein [Methylomirabilota bacterium]
MAALSPGINILAGGEHRLLTDIGRGDPGPLAAARKRGAYQGLERAITRLTPDEVIAEIEVAG